MPNYPLPDFTAQSAAAYKASIDATAIKHDLLAGQFYAHEAVTPDMTVVVEGGRMLVSGVLVVQAQQTTAAIVAPVTNPRIDRLVLDGATGALEVVTGVEAASPVAPAIPAGKQACAQVALVVSQTAVLNSDITDERVVLTSEKLSINWIRAHAIGNGLSITGSGPALTALSGTDVAYIDSVNDQLRTYRFDGTNWAQVGNNFAITGVGTPYLAALNGTDVAFIDITNKQLRTYRFDGTNWAQVGNSLAITGTWSSASITALNGTDVAFIEAVADDLITYRFDGTNWAQVGNSLSLAAGTYIGLTTLSTTDVALADFSSSELRAYRFDGTDWAQVGNGTVIAQVGELAALNNTDVVLVDSTTSDEFKVYRFDGTNWAQVGESTPLQAALSGGSLATLNGTDVAYIESFYDTLQTYRFAYYMGNGPHRTW